MNQNPEHTPAVLRIHRIAVFVAIIGIGFGLFAVAFAWLTRGQFADETLAGVMFAALATMPVYQDYRKMKRAAS